MTPLIVDPRNAGMPILYENPAEVGADRIVNAIAAYEKFGREARRPLIVCDFGTATTLDAVTAKGEYLGGAICPGVTISADALFQRAARLPRIDVRKPATVIGRTTVGAMESGLFYGYVGMVEGLVRRMSARTRRQCAVRRDRRTGRDDRREIPAIEHVDLDLTLRGLRMVWERNQSTTAARSKPTSVGRTTDISSASSVHPSSSSRRWEADGVPLKIAFEASIGISSATTARGRGAGRSASISATPTSATSSTNGGAPSAWRADPRRTANPPRRRARPAVGRHCPRISNGPPSGSAAHARPARSARKPTRSSISVSHELDVVREAANGLRGEARRQAIARLTALDEQLLQAARASIDAAAHAAIEREADEELSGFRERMPDDAYRRARAAAIDRLIRQRLGLPVLTYE